MQTGKPIVYTSAYRVFQIAAHEEVIPLEELFEILTWAQIGLHAKPVGVLNAFGYYDWLLKMLEHAQAHGFIYDEHRLLLHIAGEPEALLDALQVYQLPEGLERWLTVPHTVRIRGEGSEFDALRRIADGHLPTVAIDATGNKDSMAAALRYVDHTGKVVYVGITTEEICFRHPILHAPELTLMASRNALPRDLTRIIGLIEQGRLDTRPWITHRTGFAQLIGEFDSFTRPETGVIKAMVELG